MKSKRKTASTPKAKVKPKPEKTPSVSTVPPDESAKSPGTKRRPRLIDLTDDPASPGGFQLIGDLVISDDSRKSTREKAAKARSDAEDVGSEPSEEPGEEAEADDRDDSAFEDEEHPDEDEEAEFDDDDDDEDYEDEEQVLVEPSAEAWVLAASGELGDEVIWEREFKPIERLHDLLSTLEELPRKKVDWKHLLEGLPRFKEVPLLSFPPLYDLRDLDYIDGFLVLTGRPEVETPRMSFTQLRIYVDRDQRANVLADVARLVERLLKYPPLAAFLAR